jgi:hypothetical protein
MAIEQIRKANDKSFVDEEASISAELIGQPPPRMDHKDATAVLGLGWRKELRHRFLRSAMLRT